MKSVLLTALLLVVPTRGKYSIVEINNRPFLDDKSASKDQDKDYDKFNKSNLNIPDNSSEPGNDYFEPPKFSFELMIMMCKMCREGCQKFGKTEKMRWCKRKCCPIPFKKGLNDNPFAQVSRGYKKYIDKNNDLEVKFVDLTSPQIII